VSILHLLRLLHLLGQPEGRLLSGSSLSFAVLAG
jgi:hypothetical protein